MTTIIRALLNQRENIEAGVAAVFIILGLMLATGLLATAFASVQSAGVGQIATYSRPDPDAAGLERYYRQGGMMPSYQVVF